MRGPTRQALGSSYVHSWQQSVLHGGGVCAPLCVAYKQAGLVALSTFHSQTSSSLHPPPARWSDEGAHSFRSCVQSAAGAFIHPLSKRPSLAFSAACGFVPLETKAHRQSSVDVALNAVTCCKSFGTSWRDGSWGEKDCMHSYFSACLRGPGGSIGHEYFTGFDPTISFAWNCIRCLLLECS